MPGMRELKNHLRSVNTTGQLAGAMKTVSSAKFSRVNAVYAAYAKYGKNADLRGGGIFSGRMTAPLCVVGGVALSILKRKNV